MADRKATVQTVGILPTQAMQEAGRKSLVPELLASVGAKYSRTDEGIDSILAEVDPVQQEKTADRILKFAVDYGHQSIMDMSPVAMFIDNISMYLIYWMWSQCPTAAGQETSTRYVKFSPEHIADPDYLGIHEEYQPKWRENIDMAYQQYNSVYNFWLEEFNRREGKIGIPTDLLQKAASGDRKSAQAVERMKRNYAFDRSRYWIPMAALNNVMLIMNARGWASLVKKMLSSGMPEAETIGTLLKHELELVVPRLMKHSDYDENYASEMQEEDDGSVPDFKDPRAFNYLAILNVAPPTYLLRNKKFDTWNEAFAADLKYHNNRYGPIGKHLRMTSVGFGWVHAPMGEIRDLNRHRTGNKFCSPVPTGFYGALDQLDDHQQAYEVYFATGVGAGISSIARDVALNPLTRHISPYYGLMGTSYSFYHTTTADKYIYEMELRTGTGAHYSYSNMCKQSLQHWYDMYPGTKGLIHEGHAEPE